MNKYTLIGEYNLAEGQKADTCEHCGRAIKTVFTIRDNMMNETFKVGMTCVGTVMNLNETFEKALIKELKKYDKIFKEVNSFVSGENEALNMRELLIKQDKKFLKKFNGVVYDETINTHRCWTLKEFDDDFDNIVKSRKMLHEINLKELEKQKEKLNKLSKKGLIEID